jgi:PAS domain S-box-containing protein
MSRPIAAPPTAADRLVTAADAVGIGLLEVDHGTRTVVASPGFLRIVGLAPGAPLSDDDWRERIHPDDRAAVLAIFDSALADGHEHTVVHRLRRADGEWRSVDLRVRATRDGDGRVRTAGVVVDVTDARRGPGRREGDDYERVEALQRVAAALGVANSRTEVAHVVVTLGAAFLDARVGGLALPVRDDATLVEILEADAAGLRTYRVPLAAGLPVTAAIRDGLTYLFTSRADVLARFPTALASSAAAPDAGASAAVAVRVNGDVAGAIAFTWTGARAVEPRGAARLDTLARLVGGALDRVALLDAERAARAEAEAARRAAEQANHAKSEFLAVMSHELRTPLNAIGGHVELLEMGIHGPLLPKQVEALGRVTRAQRHLLALITDLLNFSRIEAGRIEYDLEDVELGELIASVAPLIEPQLAARQLTYHVRAVEPAGGAMIVRADRDKLRQVLLNLLSNAVKYTEPNGQVSVDIWRRGDARGFGFVRVRDTGCGIAPEKLEEIFEPFVRVDAGHTRRTDGAGLGLAIARDLARGMGGDLRARSVVGEGSSFTVSIPLA